MSIQQPQAGTGISKSPALKGWRLATLHRLSQWEIAASPRTHTPKSQILFCLSPLLSCIFSCLNLQLLQPLHLAAAPHLHRLVPGEQEV